MPQNTGEPHGLGLTAVFLLSWAVTNSHLARTVPKTKTPSAADFSKRSPCRPGVSLPRPICRRPITQCKAVALLRKTLHSVQLRNNPQTPQRAWAEPPFAPHSTFAQKRDVKPVGGRGISAFSSIFCLGRFFCRHGYICVRHLTHPD